MAASKEPATPQIWRLAEGPPVPFETATLVWPKPNATICCVIVQWPMHQLETHFANGATVVCTRKLVGTCRLCDDGLRVRWLGFVGGFEPGAGRYVLAEVTPGAVRSCPSLLTVDKSYVNYRLRIARLGASRRARCTATLLDPVPKTKAPRAINFHRVIAHVFGLATRNGYGVETGEVENV